MALAVADSDDLEFVVVDGIQVAERRSAERTPAGHRGARHAGRPATDHPARRSAPSRRTSAWAGALLLKRPGLGQGPRWQIELFLPGDPEHVHCEAELARETPTHLGVRLVNIAEADQLRVAGVLAGLQRRSPALV